MGRYLGVVAAVCSALGLMLGAGASAAETASLTAAQLETVLREAGLEPVMTEDAATGAPVASATLGEVKFFVRALNCDGSPPACENLVFFANFDLGRAAETRDFRLVNHFNDSELFGRAYIIERRSEVGIEYVIELGGGVSDDHLSQNVGRWSDIVQTFVEKFSAGETGA
ncbi:MAG: YbjN domain-containing protein [Pseudomonadota bacterium]